MNIKTTTSPGKPKPFAWSYSKLKNFETCPKRNWHVDIAKDFREEESEQLTYGNTLHKVLAEAVGGSKPLPAPFKHLQVWVDKIKASGAKVLVEQQMAINEDFGPTTWFGDDVWYRGIADVIVISGPVAMAVDWKSGKILEDGVQLALMAACIFAHHPQVEKIRTEFIWLKQDATTRADFSRADLASVWAGVLPRVATMKAAHDQMNFPPHPGPLCRRYCPVTSCPYHGI